MTRYIQFIIRRRWWVLSAVMLITVLSAVYSAKNVKVGTSLGKLFLAEMPEYQEFKERVKEFGSDEIIIVAIEDIDVLAPETLDKLEVAVEKIKAITAPGQTAAAAPPPEDDDFGFEDSETEPLPITEVARVDTVLDAQEIVYRDNELQVERYGKQVRENPSRKAEILDKLRQDSLHSGLLVSPNGRHTVVVVELVPDEDRTGENAPQLVSDIQNALVDAGFAREKLRTVGFFTALSAMIEQSNVSMKQIFPFTGLVLLIVVYLMFHRLWPVALSMGVSLIGVIWTMTFAIWIDPQVNIMLSMVPAVTLIVGFSDVIHLCSAYLNELASGKSKDEALLDCGVDVGTACLYTSMTTFVGFVSLSFIPTPAFRQLGIVLGFGVAIALLLAMTLVPIAFSIMRTPRPWRLGATSWVQDLLDKILWFMSRAATQRPWAVIGVFAVVVGIAAVGVQRIYIDTEMTGRFDEDSKIRKDSDFFKKHFSRANFMEFYVDAPEGKDLIDPDVMAKLQAFQAAAEKEPDVNRIQSIVNLIERIHGEMAADVPDAGPLPTTRNGLSEYILLFEMNGGEGLNRLLNFDRDTARVTVRVNGDGVREAATTGTRLAELAQQHLGDSAVAQPNGGIYLMGKWMDEIILGQGRGLIFTIITITFMMAFAMRSVLVGLWSMIPNFLPLFLLGGYCGLESDVVDSDTLFLAMLAIGIGVDDTIHFMVRFRMEFTKSQDAALALRRTFDFAGRAIVITTAVLALGFAPFVLSSYYSVEILGTLLPMTLVSALLADLLLVPAMASVGVLKWRPKRRAV